MIRYSRLGYVALNVSDLGRHGIGWREVDAGECPAAHIGRAIRMVEPVTGVTLEFYGSGMQRMDTDWRDFISIPR